MSFDIPSLDSSNLPNDNVELYELISEENTKCIEEKSHEMELNDDRNVIVNENFRRSDESFQKSEFHPDVIKMKATTDKSEVVKNGKTEDRKEKQPSAPSTTYLETLTHLFKGNVGPGIII